VCWRALAALLGRKPQGSGELLIGLTIFLFSGELLFVVCRQIVWDGLRVRAGVSQPDEDHPSKDPFLDAHFNNES